MSDSNVLPDLAELAANAVRDVLQIQFKLQFKQEAAAQSSLDNPVSAQVAIHGSGMEGAVSVQVARSLAVPMLETMLGAPCPPDELEPALQDLARELCNMLAGRFGAYLAEAGHPVDLGIPDSSANNVIPADEASSGSDQFQGRWVCDDQPLEAKFDFRTTHR
jgi:hypothetical protein